jgi:hypothetical protein
MTAVEWIVAVAVVAGLWVYALWLLFAVDRKNPESPDFPDYLAEEIGRWQQASARTYERQGIRRTR